jgi:hypothetical protein
VAASTTLNAGNISCNDGGTLRVCGNLTVSDLGGNNACTIIIEEGGTLTINGSGTLNFNGNRRIYNRGTLVVNRNLTMQNDGNRICVHGPQAQFQMPLTTELNFSGNDAFLSINEAQVSVGDVRLNSNNGGIYLTRFGSISGRNITANNNPNRVIPCGSADERFGCFRYTGTAQMNQQFANTNHLTVCRGPASSPPSPQGFGSATVQTNCAACVNPFPVELLYFSAERLPNHTSQLRWATATESHNAFFTLARADDALVFQDLARIRSQSADGHSRQVLTYQYTDELAPAGVAYYRLSQTDLNGQTTVLGTVSVWHEPQTLDFTFSRPGQTSPCVKLPLPPAGLSPSPGMFRLMSLDGRHLPVSVYSLSSTTWFADAATLPTGIYVLSYRPDPHVPPVTYKIILP